MLLLALLPAFAYRPLNAEERKVVAEWASHCEYLAIMEVTDRRVTRSGLREIKRLRGDTAYSEIRTAPHYVTFHPGLMLVCKKIGTIRLSLTSIQLAAGGLLPTVFSQGPQGETVGAHRGIVVGSISKEKGLVGPEILSTEPVQVQVEDSNHGPLTYATPNIEFDRDNSIDFSSLLAYVEELASR